MKAETASAASAAAILLVLSSAVADAGHVRTKRQCKCVRSLFLTATGGKKYEYNFLSHFSPRRTKRVFMSVRHSYSFRIHKISTEAVNVQKLTGDRGLAYHHLQWYRNIKS